MKKLVCNEDEGRLPMLVLSRRVYETLLIGNDIKVTVLGIKGGQVRLGIAAPTEIPIRRENFFQLSKATAHDSEKT